MITTVNDGNLTITITDKISILPTSITEMEDSIAINDLEDIVVITDHKV